MYEYILVLSLLTYAVYLVKTYKKNKRPNINAVSSYENSFGIRLIVVVIGAILTLIISLIV
jgi:Ca2+/Na+ antiporter